MDVLSLLANHSGKVIARDTLIDDIWGVQFGGEDSLSRAISILRKTFREAGATVDIIETIPKRGYRLILSVEWIEPTVQANATVSAPSSQTRGRSNQFEEKRVAKTNAIGRPQAILIVGVLLIAGVFAFSFFSRQNSDPPVEKITVSTVVETPERSLAVLPFSDLSPSGDQEYFSDGISEEILNVMAKLDGLYVAGQTSAFAFKGKQVGLREIGETLNVAYVLEGSIQKQDDRVRIRARLVEAADGYQVWSESYDRNIEDIFAIQDESARTIAKELDIVLESTSNGPLAAVLTTSNEAHDLVLKARAAYRRSPTRRLLSMQKPC
jgi:TolB-like protein/DNA-binding winged helix-turn-helix (wHTH) protein